MRIAALLVVGAVLAIAVVAFARLREPKAELRILAIALVIAALIYVAFAFASAAWPWVAVEAGGVVLFGFFALLGVRTSPWWLALGWKLHVGWDVLLHLASPRPFVGSWYPILCVSFDLVVAAYLSWRTLSARAQSRAAAL